MYSRTVCLCEFNNDFADAVEFLKKTPGTTLVIPKGEYILSGKLSREAQRKLFCGEFSQDPQKFMFTPKYKYDVGVDLKGLKDVCIDAEGVRFMVDGYMEPIRVSECENIELRGFSVDHIRKPYSRGTVDRLYEKDGKLFAEILLDKGCEIKKGVPLGIRHLFVDPKNGKSLKTKVCRSEFISESRVLEEISEANGVFEGALFYTIHTGHSRPAILLEKSKNVYLKDVSIHSNPGMGIVGNRCENVYISGLKVVPSNGDHVSTNSDATHFTSCCGDLCFESCEASYQGDDFTNVHAYFQAIVGKDGERTYYIQEKTPDGTHSQTLDYPDEGDSLELVSHDSLEKLGEYTVISCEPMPERWMSRVTLDKALPENTEGLILADITRLPSVTVRNCRISSHFARSILLKNRCSLIENCVFEDVQGPAIVAAAESWWYEGVCPANVVVRNNRMINCASFWGEASGVVVKADCNKPAGQSIYNIVVENNFIESPSCEHGVFVRNTSGVVVRNNTIISKGNAVEIRDCENTETD
ncbi:MAG: right-handed parallel beta-helix repeat-containing protein [Clostridia bacterium]|nr:right-handed parallel beta-helix repeat-containing protein [Clostridia bacterium]